MGVREIVTKRSAATRQLAQAIRLFFDRGDMLAVHTLAAASNQLFLDLGRHSGVPATFRDAEYIRPEKRTEYFRALANTENFLKHADRDPEDALEYAEEETSLVLFEAVVNAQLVFEWKAKEAQAFRLWCVHAYPDIFHETYAAKTLESAARRGADLGDKNGWSEWLRSGD